MVKAADILNAFVMVLNREKIWTVIHPEIGDNAGKFTIIVRALYSLKSAGATFRSCLAQCMQELGYESCEADLNLWMKPETM